jgi:hypothetical protein
VDKYDEAIAWLNKEDAGRGSYLVEVASLLEELLGRVFELEAGALPDVDDRPPEVIAQQAAYGRQQAARLRAWGESQRGSSAAIDAAE